jgi:hypothetical protein
VNSRLAEEFLACFARLPEPVKAQVRKNYRLWKDNPSHPSLQFKRIHTREAMDSLRVGRSWRALGLLDGDTVTWFWIGSHTEYDRLIQ